MAIHLFYNTFTPFFVSGSTNCVMAIHLFYNTFTPTDLCRAGIQPVAPAAKKFPPTFCRAFFTFRRLFFTFRRAFFTFRRLFYRKMNN